MDVETLNFWPRRAKIDSRAAIVEFRGERQLHNTAEFFQNNSKSNQVYCLSNSKFDGLVGPLDEIVTVSVEQIQRHNATS